MNSLFTTTLAIASRFNSTTMRVFSSDSSRKSLISSKTFSLMRSAILVTRTERLTAYGISVSDSQNVSLYRNGTNCTVTYDGFRVENSDAVLTQNRVGINGVGQFGIYASGSNVEVNKNEILNSTPDRAAGIYLCTVEVYSFIRWSSDLLSNTDIFRFSEPSLSSRHLFSATA